MADSSTPPARREPVGRGLREPPAADVVTDAQLVHQVGGGDQGAFAELYDRYCRQAYSLAKRICADPEFAEDVVQEAFLAFWKTPGRFDPARGSFATWLLTLVHHRAVDAVRRESVQRRRTVPQLDEATDAGVSPSPGADHAALTGVIGGQVRDALRRLPEDQRQVLALAYFGGYTQCEVAVLTGVPLGTVKSRTFAGVRRLRGLLGSLVNGDDGDALDQMTGERR